MKEVNYMMEVGYMTEVGYVMEEGTREGSPFEPRRLVQKRKSASLDKLLYVMYVC